MAKSSSERYRDWYNEKKQQAQSVAEGKLPPYNVPTKVLLKALEIGPCQQAFDEIGRRYGLTTPESDAALTLKDLDTKLTQILENQTAAHQAQPTVPNLPIAPLMSEVTPEADLDTLFQAIRHGQTDPDYGAMNGRTAWLSLGRKMGHVSDELADQIASI